MSLTLDSAVETHIEGPGYGALFLVEMRFGTGTLRVTNYPTNITALSQTWTGLGALGSVGDLKESEDGRAQKVELTLSGVDSSNKALALGSVSNYQNRAALIYVGIMDDAGRIVAAPTLRFSGFMDRVRIESEETDEGVVNSIVMECQSGSYDPNGNPASLRLNDAQHRARHPGERGFEQVQGLIGKPQPYVTARFQRQN